MLEERGISVELNVVDVSGNSAAAVEEAFQSYNVAQSDVLVALLFRDAFDRAAQLAQQAGIYIVNPMATRSDICAENPYVVKLQPSLEGQVSLMLKNMKAERPNGHLYIIHSGSEADRAVREELKRQLDERKDIKYTLFNWSHSAKLAATLKATPDCKLSSQPTQCLQDSYADTLLLYRLDGRVWRCGLCATAVPELPYFLHLVGYG